MFRRKSLVFILLFFFIFMSVPVQAFDATEISEGVYIYDGGMELEGDVEDKLRRNLIEFDIQTDIRVILVTVKEGKVNEVIKDVMQNCEDNAVVIAFSKSQRTVGCSDTEIDISKHIKSILNVTMQAEYNEFVQNSTIDILNQIAKKEKVSFEPIKEEIHLIDFVDSDDLNSLRKIAIFASSLIIALLVALIIVVKIIRLCIIELKETFFGSKFE